ncbi:MAG: hypothetical protein ACYCZO_01600 [Daejeonella sp.]
MKIILGITGILLLAVFSVAYLYFSNLTANSRNNDKTLAGIPSDASAIFQFSNDKSLYEIFKDYTVFDAIAGSEKREQLSWLKELLLNNEEFYSRTRGQKVFLSFHPSETGNIAFLCLMPLNGGVKLSDAELVLKKQPGNKVLITEALGFSLLAVQSDRVPETFYVGIANGIARGSFSKELLLKSLDDNSKKINPEFVEEVNNSILKDQNDLANLFIDHSSPGFLNYFFKLNPDGNFSLFNRFSAHASLNMNYKSDALMFNGTTRITAKKNGYIGLFLEQRPVKNTIKRIVPDNLSNSVSYGLSDYALFHHDLKNLFKQRHELTKLNEQIKVITTETGIDPDRDIKKLWGNEFSALQLSTFENLAIIRITNGRQLSFFLEPISSRYSDVVRKLNYANLFYYYFGDPLKKFARPFYTITDNMVIISNSPATVQRFLNDYNSGRLLYRKEAFTQFDQLIADQSNISFLMHFGNSGSLIKSLLKNRYSDIFTSNEYGLKNFYGLSYQLTGNKDHFFTNFYMGYKNAVTGRVDSLVYTPNSVSNN